jgi:hypothetical protein
MRFARAVLVALSVLAPALTQVQDASACGACFVPPVVISQMESTQVSGHRMVLSISKTRSTLWDQISYVGNPTSFAWVLPIKGMVDVDVSSDALFSTLEALTQVTINSPRITCPSPPVCASSRSNAAAAGVLTPPQAPSPAGELPDKPQVTVIAQEVVGPYETVQLSSTNPGALKTWLSGHGYSIPPEVDPILSSYLAEGFDFLALKLVPGQGVQAMKPVRVTTLGASPILPLRMVGVGAGAIMPITLFVLGEGKYVPSNFPVFTMPEDKLVWDWDSKESNYKRLRGEGFSSSTSSKGWLLESGEPISQSAVLDPLLTLVTSKPEESGYTGAQGMSALQSYQADIQALFASIPATTLTLTRLYAELPKEALATDLTVEAASDQTPVKRVFNITKTEGTPPPCPTYPPCASDGGCAVADRSEDDASVVPFGALLALGGVLVRRRKARRADLP